MALHFSNWSPPPQSPCHSASRHSTLKMDCSHGFKLFASRYSSTSNHSHYSHLWKSYAPTPWSCDFLTNGIFFVHYFPITGVKVRDQGSSELILNRSSCWVFNFLSSLPFFYHLKESIINPGQRQTDQKAIFFKKNCHSVAIDFFPQTPSK